MLKKAFASPGLYLFASGKDVPLYWGRTGTALWKRLSNRYLATPRDLSKPRSQFWLAATYEEALRSAAGVSGFPEKVRDWYRSWNSPGTIVRLRHAVAFAQHGIDDIWITVLPVKDASVVKGFESQVIAVAQGWNQAQRHPPLLNDKA